MNDNKSKDLVDRLAILLEDLRLSNELMTKFPLKEEYKKSLVISYEKLGQCGIKLICVSGFYNTL